MKGRSKHRLGIKHHLIIAVASIVSGSWFGWSTSYFSSASLIQAGLIGTAVALIVWVFLFLSFLWLSTLPNK